MGRKSQPKSSPTTKPPVEPVPLTFMGHVRELRRRLFWTAVWFVIVSGIIFPFFHDIIQILMRPLGNEKLYFLSPVGGLSFAMKICMYVGMIATLPVLIYNLYRFIAPAMPNHRARTAIGYVCLSIGLAICGILFAYTVSLPSAIHFLTHFDIGNVSAMLTVDAYLSFIVSYVLAGAILFQLPLIMVIIDNITPTPPSKWNKYQRHMIVAAFVIAMLITPVPDIINQVILALPILLMYQLGILMVWMRHRKKRRSEATSAVVEPEFTAQETFEPSLSYIDQPNPVISATIETEQPSSVVANNATPMTSRRSMDGFIRRTKPAVQPPRTVLTVPTRPAVSPAISQNRPTPRMGTMDGFLPAR